MRKIGSVLLVFALLFCMDGCRAFARWHSRLRGDVQQEYIVQDARNRIGNYEWYYDQYHAIRATVQKVKIAEGTAEQQGIRMVLAGMVEEYNSRSHMEITRELWKAGDLPYQIDLSEVSR
jgi:hypothetical protein